MKNNLLFVLGMRRSGTSILRILLNRHPMIETLKFEPHEVVFACRLIHLNRYKNESYYKNIINYYKEYKGEKFIGFKEVFNVGIESMNWRWLYRNFPNAKFVFIIRDCETNYESWRQQDLQSVRGICSYEMYKAWWHHLNSDFRKYNNKHPNKSCIIFYHNLVENADLELEKVWNILKIDKITGANKLIHKPKHWRA